MSPLQITKMSPPISISYYLCKNDGVGIIIYPQLRDASDPANKIVWDGRTVSGYKYYTIIGEYEEVNYSIAINAYF